MSVEILEYKDEDYQSVFTLHRKTVKENPGGYVQNLDFHDDIHNINEKYNAFWVMKLDQKIIGIVGLKEIKENAVELKRMEVDAEYQRAGFGKKLLSHFIKYCVSKNYKAIILNSSYTQKASHELYKSFDFEVTNIEYGIYGVDKQKFKMVYMKKVL